MNVVIVRITFIERIDQNWCNTYLISSLHITSASLLFENLGPLDKGLILSIVSLMVSVVVVRGGVVYGREMATNAPYQVGHLTFMVMCCSA